MFQVQIPNDPLWLKDHVFFLTKAGSHAYGTSTPESDEDVRGVCTLPPSVIFGFQERFEQKRAELPQDLEIYSILKFASLAVANNPNILELLFVDESSILLTTPAWAKLRDIRHLFLSKRIAATFAGYAKSQLHRIRSHRGYLLTKIKSIPTREEFGLPARCLVPKLHAADAAVQKKLDGIAGEWSIDKSQQLEAYGEVAKGLGFDVNFV